MRAPVEWSNFQCVSALALVLSLGGAPARAEEGAAILGRTPGATPVERLEKTPTGLRAAMSRAPAGTVVAWAGAPTGSVLLRGDSADAPEGGDAQGDLDPTITQPPTAETEGGQGRPAASIETPAAPASDALDSESSAQPLPPINAALKSALEARARPDFRDPFGVLNRKEREAVAAFYAARDFAPLWSTDGNANPEVKSAMERLERAADDGLDLKGFPRRPAPAGSDEDLVLADIALSDAVVAYGRQASGSRVDPHAISPLIGAKPEVAEASIILAIVATAGEDAGAALKGFNPPQKAYEALRDKLAELRRERVPAARAPSIPAGPALKGGLRDARAPVIRARLSLDGQNSAAVAKPSRLEAEILANMERWRWMPRDMGESRIEVNIPDFEVVVIENGRIVQRNRVVVGKEQTPTPIFSNKMQFLIVNPYWNVPQSIIRKEMLPKLGADPSYFRRLGYQVASVGGRLRVRQPPGERNALGRIKFMFPNDYSVYLHDTPSRALFSESRRAYSHGCVRVDDPFRFAETVLGRANGWSEQRVKGLIGGKERYVYLPNPLPVHIEYFTTYVDESGRLQLRDDVYGYSHRVKAALGLDG